MVNPTMPTDPVDPPYAGREGLIGRFAAEAWDHLWPWSRAGFQRQRAVQAAGVALGVAASVMWIVAAMGRLEAGAVIGWWFGWSVFEVIVRLGAKPYVKEGPGGAPLPRRFGDGYDLLRVFQESPDRCGAVPFAEELRPAHCLSATRTLRYQGYAARTMKRFVF